MRFQTMCNKIQNVYCVKIHGCEFLLANIIVKKTYTSFGCYQSIMKMRQCLDLDVFACVEREYVVKIEVSRFLEADAGTCFRPFKSCVEPTFYDN